MPTCSCSPTAIWRPCQWWCPRATASVCARIAASAKLSKREAEILPLALRGRTAERIAGEFFISKNTVDTHLRRIYAKCGVHTRQELIDLGERTEGEL